MDCLEEWAGLGMEPDPQPYDPLTVDQWVVIGQTVASASPKNQWTTIKLLAKYYAWKHGGAERAWIKQITAVAHAAVTETVTAQDTDEFLARHGAEPMVGVGKFMKTSLHNRSSQPLNHKPRSHSVKGQQEMFPDERGA